jgi:hypothetical protein
LLNFLKATVFEVRLSPEASLSSPLKRSSTHHDPLSSSFCVFVKARVLVTSGTRFLEGLGDKYRSDTAIRKVPSVRGRGGQANIKRPYFNTLDGL